MTSEQTEIPVNPEDEIFDMSKWSTTPPGLAATDDESSPETKNDALRQMLEPARPGIPVIDDPPPGTAELLWGIERDGRRYRTALVRELTGADEEAIARLPSGSPNFNVMVVDLHLRCAVTQIGVVDVEQDKDVLGELLISDRDILFKEVLLTTYGKTREYENVACPTCGFEMDLHIDIEGLIEVRNPKTFESDKFTVTLRDGKQVLMRFVNGKDQISVFHSGSKRLTAPEANTAFLAACVERVDGKAVADPEAWALGLGIADRRILVDSLLDIPAIGFKEVEVPCDKCGENLPTVFGWADLLPS
jgi:hypothetical protein